MSTTTRRPTPLWLRLKLALSVVFLAGYGPFICDQPDVEEARKALRSQAPADALSALSGVEDDVAAVHLARGLAHLQAEADADAKGALDQAYRVVANADARGEPLLDAPQLRARIAFARGILASRAKDWATAQVEFGKVLALEPEDEDARWNLELAWSMANPPCNRRDDDHEPDDGLEGAPPFDPAKAEKRVLCPGNEDHFTLPDLPRGAMVYVRLKGEVVPDVEADATTREVTLSFYGPGDAEDAPRRQTAVSGGVANVAVAGTPEQGTWTIKVAGPGPAEFTYGLEVEVVPPCPADDELEENDTRDAAKVLSEPEYKGLKACPGDADWYVVEVPKDEGRSVTIAFDPSRAPLAATVFAGDGIEPVGVGRSGSGGLSVKLPKGEEPQRYLIEIVTETGSENNYGIKVDKDDGDGDDEKKDDQKDQKDEPKDDQKDQKDDQKDQKDEPKDDQQKKPDDQKDEKKDGEKDQPQPGGEPPPKPPTDQVDMDRLLESLDKHPNNPQLEKALQALPVLPQMEDY